MSAASHRRPAALPTKLALAIFAAIEAAFVILMLGVFLRFPQTPARQPVVSGPTPVCQTGSLRTACAFATRDG